MKIPLKYLIENYKEYHFNDNDVLFFIIVSLHYNGHIGIEKYSGMMKGLRDNTLNKKRNVYHCKINDKWYNDESMVEILSDVYDGFDKKDDVPMLDFIKYVSSLINKNRNYAVNHIYLTYIQKIVDAYQPNTYWSSTNYDRIIDLLNDFGFDLNSNVVRRENFEFQVSGYCCSDCDGKYEDYVNNRFEHYVVEQNIADMKTKIFQVLDSYRTKDYLRNPDRLILT